MTFSGVFTQPIRGPLQEYFRCCASVVKRKQLQAKERIPVELWGLQRMVWLFERAVELVSSERRKIFATCSAMMLRSNFSCSDVLDVLHIMVGLSCPELWVSSTAL